MNKQQEIFEALVNDGSIFEYNRGDMPDIFQCSKATVNRAIADFYRWLDGLESEERKKCFTGSPRLRVAWQRWKGQQIRKAQREPEPEPEPEPVAAEPEPEPAEDSELDHLYNVNLVGCDNTVGFNEVLAIQQGISREKAHMLVMRDGGLPLPLVCRVSIYRAKEIEKRFAAVGATVEITKVDRKELMTEADILRWRLKMGDPDRYLKSERDRFSAFDFLWNHFFATRNIEGLHMLYRTVDDLDYFTHWLAWDCPYMADPTVYDSLRSYSLLWDHFAHLKYHWAVDFLEYYGIFVDDEHMEFIDWVQPYEDFRNGPLSTETVAKYRQKAEQWDEDLRQERMKERQGNAA